MSVDTYDNLKTEIANHLDRDDLSSDIDTFIDLCEARHKREVRIREMVAREDLTVDSRQESLPSGFLEMVNLRLLTNPVTVVQEINLHEMTRIRTESTGKPIYFTCYGNEIEFNQSPDSAYSGEIVYYKEQTALSGSNTTNDILTRAPDLYLYGALLAAAPFLMNDERLMTWEKLYTSARDAINMQDRKLAGPLVSRVVGATP